MMLCQQGVARITGDEDQNAAPGSQAIRQAARRRSQNLDGPTLVAEHGHIGDSQTERSGAVAVDFQRLLALDTLISDPPRSLTDDLSLIGWVDEKVDFLKRMFRLGG